MKALTWAIVGALLSFAAPVNAHPHSDMDQQVALILSQDTIDVQLIIVPSINAGPELFDHIDQDANGSIEPFEADEFAAAVLTRNTLEVDGQRTPLVLGDVTITAPEALSAGLGKISITAQTSNLIWQEVELTAAFGDFSHNWQIQPYLTQDVSSATPNIRVLRETDHSVRVVK